MVIASMATFPPRYNLALRVMQHIAPQVDRMKVYVNDQHEGRRHLPPWMQRTPANCTVYLGSRTRGTLGDVGKFYAAPTEGIHVTVDDDFFYPDDYVERICCGLNRNSGAVVGFDGWDVGLKPIGGYYWDGKVNRKHFAPALDTDYPVHMLRTGLMAYRPAQIPFPLSLFRFQNMTDIWCALRAQERQVPMVVLRHEAGWIKASATPDPGIGRTYQDNDAAQTHLVSQVEWKHYGCQSAMPATC